MKIEPQIQMINIIDIIPNRFQPRLNFDDKTLQELAASIKEHGIIQPLVLRRLGTKYEIIAGERRYKASQLAGLDRVPAIITNMSDNESAEVAVVENLQRKNLSAIEEARSYKKLLDRGYLTQDQLAARMGVSQPQIANKIRLLALTDEVQKALMNERISERHARSLLQVTDPIKQVEMLNKTINGRLTVRQLEDEIKKIVVVPPIPEVIEPSSITNFDNKFTSAPTTNPIIQSLESEIEKISAELSNITPPEITSYEKFNIPTADELNKPLETVSAPEISIPEPTPIPVTNVNTSLTIEKGNIHSAVKSIREISKNIEEANFKIETEEFDFEDIYQIIIKIEK